MPYSPQLLKDAYKNHKKLELQSYADHNIIVKGDERTKEEVIYNNIINYMVIKEISPVEQVTFLKKYKLYLYEEQNKNVGTNFMCNGLSTAGVISAIYCFGTYRDNLAYAACLLTALIMVTNAVVNKCRSNIYENPFNTQYENTFFESLIEQDEMLRKSIKYNKDAKKLLK
jgi:hypothetical protein